MAQPTKADLRKEFLAQRDSLDPADRARKSSLIRQRLFNQTAWKNASSLLCYVSFGSEVETHALIQEAVRMKKKVFVPLFTPGSDDVQIAGLSRFGELAPGPNPKILQPAKEFVRPGNPADIDLVLAPGMVFDRQGGRIGFGGGYFDRLMAQMPRAARVGLAFDLQLSASDLPLESYDVRLHMIITEKEIITTRSA